jgi:DNA-binding transcriptional regulator GbsR (MarR family)
LIDERDRKVIGTIERLLKENGKVKKSVGIVYGAMHMRNITAYLLRKQGYRIVNSEWVTVFDL